jgi:hypothetical protein
VGIFVPLTIDQRRQRWEAVRWNSPPIAQHRRPHRRFASPRPFAFRGGGGGGHSVSKLPHIATAAFVSNEATVDKDEKYGGQSHPQGPLSDAQLPAAGGWPLPSEKEGAVGRRHIEALPIMPAMTLILSRESRQKKKPSFFYFNGTACTS